MCGAAGIVRVLTCPWHSNLRHLQPALSHRSLTGSLCPSSAPWPASGRPPACWPDPAAPSWTTGGSGCQGPLVGAGRAAQRLVAASTRPFTSHAVQLPVPCMGDLPCARALALPAAKAPAP